MSAPMFEKPAESYDLLVGRYSAALAGQLISFARVEPGMRALDVGCGPGALASTLAKRLGAEHVAAADPSEPFVAACRERVPGAHVVVASADALPFPDDSFDATLSQLVVNFLPDATAGVREMARVTRPGGIVAACVWDYADGMTMLRAFWDAAREIDSAGGAAADEGAVMPWTREGELASLWEAAGLTAVRSGALTATAAYEDFDDLWSPLPTGIGPAGAYAASLDGARQARLREALRRRLGVGDGPFELTARAWAVAGAVGS